ncbi:sensor histidine kinase [Gordonia zhaorongruii]|uniref:sensor histidine kinase n=1 Tax=Gordonia zhaorongruii TaxID=2597659 RepID=UPI001043A4C1|nr:HAMP domain-containing sensor histidine kinase [Gordonia zhaorongruii]
MIARFLPSLRARVLLGTVLVVCATALGVGGSIALASRSWIYQDAQETAFAIFANEMDEVRSSGAPVPQDVMVTRDGAVERDPAGLAQLIPDRVREAVDANATEFRFERLSDGRVAIGYRPGTAEPATSYFVIRPLDDVPERLDRLMTILVLSVAGSAVLGIVLGTLVVRTVVKPLHTVRSTARQIAAGDSSVRIPATGVSELHDLTTSLNEMLDEKDAALTVLREEEQRASRFASDVSHELRSPLAALVPAAEVLDEELSGEAGVRGRAARLVSHEITALSGLVEDLLEMTRRDAGRAEVRSESVDLPPLLRDALDLRGWTDVPVITDGSVEVVTDPRRLTAIVTNLVGNAIRHGREPVSVQVEPGEASSSEGGFSVRVSDHGRGIPDEHLPRVFERMYKASDARTRSGGAGLGLAIAKENAHLLGGDVTYSRTDGVTVFAAEFPGQA